MARRSRSRTAGSVDDQESKRRRLETDGGTPEDEKDDEAKTETDDPSEHREGAGNEGKPEDDDRDDGDSPVDRADVEVADAGEATPADPKWEKPDLEEIPEFEIGGEQPTARHGRRDSRTGDTSGQDPSTGGADGRDPTAGRPNRARSPGTTRIGEGGTDGYVVALELCARLPDDVRLPEEAADLVPAAVEAELEEDVQAFAAAEFDNPSPTVDALEFVERGDEVWLRIRLGISPSAFADLDPDEIRAHALQELEGLF